MGLTLLELFEKRKKEYFENDISKRPLSFSQKLENRIEQLKLSSLSKKEKDVNNESIKYKNSIGSVYFEVLTNLEIIKDDEFSKEYQRIDNKKSIIAKKDEEFRKEKLREIKGKGFNSQKIELLLDVLPKDNIEQLFYFHDLFQQLYELFIINFNFSFDILEKYADKYLIKYKLSTEPYRVLRN